MREELTQAAESQADSQQPAQLFVVSSCGGSPVAAYIRKGRERMETILDARQMKQCDRDTIEQLGIPSAVLMERAALAVVEELYLAKLPLARVLVVCGPGNNGGDGFAVARLLAERGVRVTTAFVGTERSMTEECRLQKKICENSGIKSGSYPEDEEYTTIVDALFGIGLSRPVTGVYAEVIERINQSPAARVAVDLPSGIDTDTGQVWGTAVRADLTVTFAAKKLGQILYPGAEYCGRTVCRPIGIRVPGSSAREQAAFWNTEQSVLPVFCCTKEELGRIPKRRPYSNKGSYGKVFLIAGSEGMSGAACLAARAAYRSGCGLVRVLTPQCNRQVLQQYLPEAIVSSYETVKQAEQLLLEGLHWADAVGIGPGLGTGTLAGSLLRRTLQSFAGPMVIDADGLNLIAEDPTLLKGRSSDAVIVTPHIGEMLRLTGLAKETLLADLIGSCRSFAGKHRVICVQKDARTVVSDGSRVCINLTGNSGMAAGGSGDVLTGVLCGLLAQGMEPFAAAAIGVFLHGLAGDAARKRHGSYGMLAGETADCVGEVLRSADTETRRGGIQ